MHALTSLPDRFPQRAALAPCPFHQPAARVPANARLMPLVCWFFRSCGEGCRVKSAVRETNAMTPSHARCPHCPAANRLDKLDHLDKLDDLDMTGKLNIQPSSLARCRRIRVTKSHLVRVAQHRAHIRREDSSDERDVPGGAVIAGRPDEIQYP